MGVPQGLDHLVYAVPDLERAAAELHSALGVGPRAGGQHPGLGTHNAILSFADGSYLELIAADPLQPAPGAPRAFGIDDLHAPRLVTWALARGDLDDAVLRARERGYDAGRVLALSRTRPDGVELHWRLSLRPDGFGGGLVPFLIDWGATPHPSEPPEPECQLVALRAEHPDPAGVAAALSSLATDLEVRSGPRPRLEALLRGPRGDHVLGSGD